MTTTSSEVALVATVHDPDNRLYELTKAKLPELFDIYASVSLLCSASTHHATLDLLERYGVMVRKETRRPGGHKSLGRVRREALQAGLASRVSHFQLCDFDRALHWITHYPEEMRGMLTELPRYDFLIMGRTPRAWETHPEVQKRTEALSNLVFSKIYGQDVDIAGGSRGLSREAARLLTLHSREETVGVDSEWPLILKRFPELTLGYRAYDGLEHEALDGRDEEIAQAGGYEMWEQAVLDSPQAWLLRIGIAYDTVAAAVRAGQTDYVKSRNTIS